jgi:predicted nucleic acid-binding protein
MGLSFLDSNILLYIASSDPAKADRAEALVAGGGHISVQVLNEVTAVARRKMGLSWAQINAFPLR